MDKLNLRSITNNFLDVRLLSLASWRQAGEISPRDHGGPYVVLQEGYNPNDPKMTPDEFILGRSGQWLSLGRFYQLPVDQRRAEFVFGTAGEIMQMMEDLPTKVVMFGHGKTEEAAPAGTGTDEMATAIKAAKSQGGAGPSTTAK
jgi:hypothetical protein